MPNKQPLVLLAGFAAALSTCIVTMPGHASLIDFGITYDLTESATADPLTNHFVLGISGINGPTDAEGGRSGVNALAFTQPNDFSTATPPSGFSLVVGGFNSSGCSGSGNFYCFAANTTPPSAPALPNNSSLNFTFDVSLSSGSFVTYVPDFKIDWVGSKNNYDLVSLALAPTPSGGGRQEIPEPGTLMLLGAALVGVGVFGGRRLASR
jgi:hypothetical protein